MNAAALLLESAEQGVLLFHQDGQLGFELTRDTFPDELKERIVANRAALIEYLARMEAGRPSQALRPAIEPRVHRDPLLPLSYAQQRLWFIDRMSAGSPHYNMPSAWRIAGDFQESIAAAALQRIIDRHEVLRTVFVDGETGPLQRVRDRCDFVLGHTDLQGFDESTQQHRVRAALADDAARLFDLGKDVLLRASFLKLSACEGVLLLNMHHIAADGWSMRILMQEFVQCYEALAQGVEPQLPPLKIQYADYAMWQRQWLQGKVLEQQLQYWQTRLAGLPQVHSLHLDHARPAVQSFAGGVHTIEVDRTVLRSLRDLAQSTKTTLFMVLHAVFTVLLRRHSDSGDIVVGTPMANRMQRELEPLVGFFANTLVLRVQCELSRTFLDHLQQVKRANLEAQMYQDLPFELLVERLQPVRSASHSPLFQIVFGMNTVAKESIRLASVRATPLTGQQVTAKFDLEMAAQESGPGLRLTFIYNRDLFEPQTIERLGAHFARLLRSVAANPKRRIGELELISERERQQLLYGFNRHRGNYSQHRCLHELFESQVEKAPHAIAAVHEQRCLSYRQLNERANQLAHYLRAHGVRPDTLVGLCVERSLEMVIGILGILKAGGAYVPLDPSYPAERLAHMLEDSAPAVLLTQAALQRHLPAVAATVLCLDGASESLGAYPRSNPERDDVGVAPHHLSYVIYTSGSTGRPKGVMVEHRNVTRLFMATQDWFHFNSSDVWTLFHSIAFDFSVWEIWGALLHGGRLIIVPALCARTPQDFYALVCSEGVTVLNQTPSAFRQLILAQSQSKASHSLRCVVFGGEALEMHLLEPWIARNASSETQLINMYGITEITVHATYRPITREDVRTARGSPIGRAIPDLQIYVLDSYGEPVPVGVTGELYVAGAGVARGYLNRAELTSERFVVDPFSHDPGARMYKTGDLGRWSADGSIEYLGRNDSQVKIRGFRIEPGEIEARLLVCEGIREAVVIAREDRPGEKRLVAYVVSQPAAALSVRTLHETLQAGLAAHMVPSAYVVLESLPLTENGKLDRAALPVPDGDAVLTRAYVPPIGEAEREIAEVWQQLLGIPRIGRHDHFFELGGHSLLVIRMIESLRQRGVKLDAKAAFLSPTLGGLAAHHRRDEQEKEPGAPPNRIEENCLKITPDLLPLVSIDQQQIDAIVAGVAGGVSNVQDIYPLSPLQQVMWAHHLLSDELGADTYVLRSVLAFADRARLQDFLSAFQRVIDRHDILRTALCWRGLEQPLQVVYRQALLPVEEHSLAGDVLGQLLALTDPCRVRLDLQHAPLLRAHVAADPSSGEWLLALLSHHLIDDNYSLRLAMEEILLLLQGRADLLRAPIPYRDFIWRTNAIPVAEHEQYFREQLGDLREPTAPFGVLDARNVADEASEVRMSLGQELTQRIRQRAREQAVSPAVLFHLVWAQVLAQCSGRDDVVFGTVLSGRLQGSAEADQALGMFINTLPIRLRLADLSVSAAVAKCFEQLSQLLRHEQAPLAVARRCSAVPAPLPLFTALLNCRLSNVDRSAEETARIWTGVRTLRSEERAHYPLNLSVDDSGRRFTLTAQCTHCDADRLMRYVQTTMEELVSALAEQPQRPVRTLRVMPKSETELATAS